MNLKKKYKEMNKVVPNKEEMKKVLNNLSKEFNLKFTGCLHNFKSDVWIEMVVYDVPKSFLIKIKRYIAKSDFRLDVYVTHDNTSSYLSRVKRICKRINAPFVINTVGYNSGGVIKQKDYLNIFLYTAQEILYLIELKRERGQKKANTFLKRKIKNALNIYLTEHNDIYNYFKEFFSSSFVTNIKYLKYLHYKKYCST